MAASLFPQAEALARFRKEGRALPDFPGPAPADIGEAYRLQRAVQAAMAEPVCGWKIGATSRTVQEAIGTREPFYGPLYAPRCHGSGAAVPVPEGALGIECEFAFRLAKDLPPRPEPYGTDEVVEAVGSVHPAIELVGLCLPSAAFRDVRWCIADHGLDVALIAGAGVTDWRQLDLAGLTVHAVVNGAERAAGSGAAVLGSPLVALTWLANALSFHDRGLLAGDWISTGTCTGIQVVKPGDVADGMFEGIGSVRVSFS